MLLLRAGIALGVLPQLALALELLLSPNALILLALAALGVPAGSALVVAGPGTRVEWAAPISTGRSWSRDPLLR